MILLHHGESVAGLDFEGIVLEANDRPVDLRAVLELDLVGARRCERQQERKRGEAGNGYDRSIHAFEYRAGAGERQA